MARIPIVDENDPATSPEAHDALLAAGAAGNQEGGVCPIPLPKLPTG